MNMKKQGDGLNKVKDYYITLGNEKKEAEMKFLGVNGSYCYLEQLKEVSKNSASSKKSPARDRPSWTSRRPGEGGVSLKLEAKKTSFPEEPAKPGAQKGTQQKCSEQKGSTLYKEREKRYRKKRN